MAHLHLRLKTSESVRMFPPRFLFAGARRRPMLGKGVGWSGALALLFRLSDEDIVLLRPRHRAAQAAFAILANRAFGLECAPQGIESDVGGVVVNGRPIVIAASCLFDASRKRQGNESAEEKALGAAMRRVVAMVREQGLEALDAFGEPVSGEPLHVLFGRSLGGLCANQSAPAV